MYFWKFSFALLFHIRLLLLHFILQRFVPCAWRGRPVALRDYSLHMGLKGSIYSRHFRTIPLILSLGMPLLPLLGKTVVCWEIFDNTSLLNFHFLFSNNIFRKARFSMLHLAWNLCLWFIVWVPILDIILFFVFSRGNDINDDAFPASLFRYRYCAIDVKAMRIFAVLFEFPATRVKDLPDSRDFN